jgi:arsenite/tail-anchored protein-transporting ATPase
MGLKRLKNNDLKLILFGGKGGVGKTSCAIATAIALSENFKTLLISTDPAHSLSDSLEQNIGFRLQPVKGIDKLSAIEIAAEEAFLMFKNKHQKELIKLFDTSTSLDQEDINQLLNISIPGIDEVMSFKTIIDFLEEENFDKYVVDTAPTGHALRLIASPGLLDQWIKVAAQMRWKYRYMVTTFAGEYQKDDVDSLLLSLKKTVKRIENLLQNKDACEFIPVCMPEFMIIQETQRLITNLESFKIFIDQLIINHVMESEEGSFCKRKKASQKKYLEEIHKLFGHLNLVKVPVFPEDIKGLDALHQLKSHLFDE